MNSQKPVGPDLESQEGLGVLRGLPWPREVSGWSRYSDLPTAPPTKDHRYVEYLVG